MNRFEIVANMQPGAYALNDVVDMLSKFIAEAQAEGLPPLLCPAIRLLGLQLSFFCHADVYTDPSGESLRQRCAEIADERRTRLKEVH